MKMQKRLSEREQIKMVIKESAPAIYGKLKPLASIIGTFTQLKDAIMDAEDEKVQSVQYYSQSQIKKSIEGNPRIGTAEVNAIRNRHFSNIGRSSTLVFEKLKEQGLLKPLDSHQKPLTKCSNPIYYYVFHQDHGHETERYARLKHEIQDLIDEGRIPNPEGHCPKYFLA